MNRSDGPSPHAARIASTLATIVDRYGAAALFKRDQIELLLKQESPDATKEIGLVLTALAEDVPQRLLAAHDEEALRSLLPRVVDGLARHPDFDQARASWAVRTWALALALPVDGLPATSTAASTAAPASGPVMAALTSVVKPLAGAGQPQPAPAATAVRSPPASPVPAAAPKNPQAPLEERPRPPAPPIAIPAPAVAAPTASRAAPIAAAAGPLEVPKRPDTGPSRRRRSWAIPLVATAALVAVAVVVTYAWHETRKATDGPSVVATTAPPAPRPPDAPPPPAIAAPTDVAKPSPATDAPASSTTAPPVAAATTAPVPTGLPTPIPTPAAPQPVPTGAVPAVAAPPVGHRIGDRGPARRVEPIVAPRSAGTTTAAAVPSSPQCTRASCGSVVAVRALDSGGAVELIIRMDDRDIHTVRMSGRWVVGTRVQKSGDRYVPLAP